MQVIVKHMDFDTNEFVAVAEVDVTELHQLSRMDQLEYAYRWTNNIEGSWSMKIGADANEAVTVVAPFYTDASGKQWGHRSTSVGDCMEINGTEYKVGAFGFERV